MLATIFKSKSKEECAKEKKELLSEWIEGWDFKELLLFRECSIRDEEEYVDRLDIIEDVIRYKELRDIKFSGLGVFGRRRPWVVPQGEIKIVFE